ncbi:hypothetical protein [uncultured Thiodictyon sp.]|uniref:hypothetical protein n=1 Tax=uncultured Thiodictyon sp. TaxID=1846217 RepID=UPI0025D758B1|nr:hypothetical protein [uncultured Thiodictyon sp.]
MYSQSYLPKTASARVAWILHYLENLTKFGALLGIGPEEIAFTKGDLGNLVWAVDTWYPIVRQDTLDNTAFKDLIATGTGTDPVPVPTPRPFPAPPAPLVPGVLNRLYNQVQRMKLHPAYTDGIGRELGIVATAAAVDDSPPEFTAVLERDAKGVRVYIHCTKRRHNGIVVESRINGGAWELYGHFTRGSVYDDRPLAVPQTPESRDYRLCWWDKDEPHGDWSAIVTVLVGD